MQVLIRHLNAWAYTNESPAKKWRTLRMMEMLRRIRPPKNARIIDIGGTEYVWSLVEHDFHVTLVNLPDASGNAPTVTNPKRFTAVAADGCDLRSMFADDSFDVAFSNSVIEHVGDESRQDGFAGEVRRLAPAYWIQTPAASFPIEAHTGMPLYWKWPESVRQWQWRRWSRRLPAWADMIRGTRVLSDARMKILFPDAAFFHERVWGMNKSVVAYKPFPLRAN